VNGALAESLPGELQGRFDKGRLVDGADNAVNGLREKYQQRVVAYHFNQALKSRKEVECISSRRVHLRRQFVSRLIVAVNRQLVWQAFSAESDGPAVKPPCPATTL
jgi:hypothetical protein